MQDFIITHYLWFKSFHVIAMMAWVTGLVLLPRLFAYHTATKSGSELSTTFQAMENRLLRLVMNPAMILTWVIGLVLLKSNGTLMEQGWMHAKLTLVILLSVLHMVFAKWRKTLASDKNTKSQKFYRIWSIIPAIMAVLIVILAVAEPF